MECIAISIPRWADWADLTASVRADPKLLAIITALEEGCPTLRHYSLVRGLLVYKGRVVLPASSPWIEKLFNEFHITATGEHAGAFRTY